MTGEVKKPLWGKLAKRFLVSQGSSPQMVLGDTLTPITNADSLVFDPKILESSNGVDCTTTGWKTIWTVPAGKRYTILCLEVWLGTGSTARADKFGILYDTARCTIYKVTAASQLVNYLTTPLKCEQGWSIQVNVSTSNAGDYFTGEMLYLEEDVA